MTTKDRMLAYNLSKEIDDTECLSVSGGRASRATTKKRIHATNAESASLDGIVDVILDF